MPDNIKGFITKDGEARYDFDSLANIPEVLKSMSKATALVGQHFEISKVDALGKVLEVQPVDNIVGGDTNIKCDSNGELIILSDSSDFHLLGLKLFGKTTQFITMGKNLLKPTATTQTINGVTFTVNADGSVTANGTATENAHFHITRNLNLEVGTYVISSAGPDASDTTFRFQFHSPVNDIMANIYGAEKTYTLGEAENGGYLVASVMKGYTANNLTFYPMIRLATETDATYEPYTGGMPSPNPDYPQELESVGVKVKGKNLLPNNATTQTVNGITFTVNADGSVTANGTATATAQCRLVNKYVFPVGEYIISGCPLGGDSDTKYAFNINTGAGSPYWDTGNGNTFKITESTVDSFVEIVVRNGCTVSNLTFYPMIRHASITDNTYEPYYENPQEHNNVAVTVCGKNLFPPEAINALHTYTLPAGTYYYRRFWGSSKDTNARTHAKIDGVWTDLNRLGEFDNGNIIVYDGIMDWRADKQKIVLKKAYELYTMEIAEGETLVISVDGYATEYVPYIEPQTLTAQTPNGLPGIPVSSGGNYTDENGQMWICDEIDFARGKHVQRVGKKVFDGSVDEDWTDALISNGARCFHIVLLGVKQGISTKIENALNSHFVTKMASTIYNECVVGCAIFNDKLRVFSTEIQTLDALKAFLAESPMSVLYELETPIETDLTAEEIAQYSALHTNYPNTTIYNDEGAGMKVKYVADTKMYIDNKFAELQNAILATGANI